MCVCVCVYERERERERDGETGRERREEGSEQAEGLIACGLTASREKGELQQETRVGESFF